ncbi:hypothetical protein [Streptomyces sp. CdTB01]|uniref:hypothetical protein n=1 Tax=Streptomyces sp. CdTB01 TaxID=1725411 RepID=UPI00073A7FD6|nr:hypothetical protein [Streptomyces sp. CdTB01]ALV35742.1 hypothetical protein AS200_29645 [Streptomyces sp. CdTB01]
MTDNQTNLASDTTAPVGSEANPLVISTREAAPDAADAAVTSLGNSVTTYEVAFRTSADLSSDLPADLRDLVSKAASAVTGTVATAQHAQVEAARARADKTMYPEGRELLAKASLDGARKKVDQALDQADTLMTVADASLYEAARPRLATEDAMPARADLNMLTQRHMGSGSLADVLKGIAQRTDAVGALVADPTYLRDFLSANGVEEKLSEAIQIIVRAEVTKTAAASADAQRAAAGKTSLALTELRKARAAAAAYTRHKLG